jgi:hypothetical protein
MGQPTEPQFPQWFHSIHVRVYARIRIRSGGEIADPAGLAAFVILRILRDCRGLAIIGWTVELLDHEAFGVFGVAIDG